MFEVLASSAVSAVWVWLGSCVDDWHFTERTAQWKPRNSNNAMPFVNADTRSISYRTDPLVKRLGSLSKLQGISLGRRFSGLYSGCCGSVGCGRSGGSDPQLRMPSPQSERLRFFEDLGRAFQYETTEAAVTIFLFLAPDDSIKLRYLKGYLEKRAIPACITYCTCQAGSGLEIFTREKQHVHRQSVRRYQIPSCRRLGLHNYAGPEPPRGSDHRVVCRARVAYLCSLRAGHDFGW